MAYDQDLISPNWSASPCHFFFAAGPTVTVPPYSHGANWMPSSSSTKWRMLKDAPSSGLTTSKVHFRLTDDGELTLESLGEVTEDALWEFCYPVLDGVVPDEAPEHWSTQQWAAVRQAVLKERARVHPEEVAEPETALGRDIKTQLGAPTALVDEIVRQGGGGRPSGSSNGLGSLTEAVRGACAGRC